MTSSSASLASPTPLPRVAAYERLGFGLFLHWGLYSQLGQGEWIQHLKPVPMDEYERLAGTFTAADFDARAIARLAKDAGQKYICLTTRHHDGFSLYDTRGLSDFDAPHSAAKRDLIAEFVEGCRAEGIVPFFYHTSLDWRWNSAHCDEKTWNEYLDFFHASIEVLCTHYGEVGGFFFDGHWSRQDLDWNDDRLYGIIRRLQPNAIILNNSGLHARGEVGHPEIDAVTFEQGLPSAPDRMGAPKYLAGEMEQTFNAHWGIGAQDFRYLGPPQIIETLCLCRKVGANYLLNIGPTAEGAIPPYEAAALRLAGRWIAAHPDPIYHAKPSSVKCKGRDFCLEGEDGTLFYFAHGLTIDGGADVTVEAAVKGGEGNEPRPMSNLHRLITGAQWADNGEELRFAQNQSNGLATLGCSTYRYGVERVVRVAILQTSD